MKKLIRIVLFIAFVVLAGISKSSAQTVYITDNGKKYHAKNCDIVKSGKKGIELADAKKKGLEPCKSCKVEAVKPTEKKAPATKGKK